MYRFFHYAQDELRQSIDKFWRIVQTRGHLELSDAETMGFLASLVINFAQGLHMIGDERHGNDANITNFFASEIAQGTMQRGL